MPWPLTQPSAVLATDVTAQTARHADDHNKIAALLAVLTPGPWQYVNPVGGVFPAFATNWANYSGGWQVARFRREGGDICRVEGLIAGGTANSQTAFTLPLGFRPPQLIRFTQTVGSGGGANTGYVDYYPNGNVVVSYISGSGGVPATNINATFAIDPATL